MFQSPEHPRHHDDVDSDVMHTLAHLTYGQDIVITGLNKSLKSTCS